MALSKDEKRLSTNKKAVQSRDFKEIEEGIGLLKNLQPKCF